MKVGAILVCAGKGKRLKHKKDKAFVLLGKKPLLWYSLRTFLALSAIREIVVVVSKESFPQAAQILKEKKVKVACGGIRRQDSVYQGLANLSGSIDTVLVHDGARPFVHKTHITALIKALKKNPAVTLGVPVKEALKKVKKATIVLPIDRHGIYMIQTPQGFTRDLLEDSFKRFKKRNVYDETELIGLLGKKVKVIPGDYNNIKVTYREDLEVAEAFLNHFKCR
ncbi:MAG: 2-C-methyl-D-erythritol 4-phosphate cytidylyltransferase [Candidatus Omnitrophica bacterium]|nr:2-C-methyl-D-erythritol 4-phosphate cytidylyltransferase [Candidatus Omnitrophota bacterium]